MQILVVDTDASFLSFMQSLLRGEGYTVSLCQTGTEAMMKALMQDFDLLICDIQLPDFEGVDLIRAIKAQNPHLPIFVLTTLDRSTWEDTTLSAGANQFYSKPPDTEHIKDEIAMVRLGRAGLHIGILDPDAIHRNRMRVSLNAQGCDVQVWGDMPSALAKMASRPPTLIVMDARIEHALELIAWAKARHITVFVFTDQLSDELEDSLMRAGAALILPKPVDCEALMTQARFLAAGF